MKNILDRHRKNPVKNDVMPFLSSIEEDLWILKEDVIGSIAHVIMLYEENIILKDVVIKILNSLKSIYDSILDGSFKLNLNFEDIHPYIENIVINDVGIEIGGKIHSARSRNDQVALDIRLKIRKEIIILIDLLIELEKSFLNLATESKKYYIPLYTHLQRGQLGVFSHYIINYCFNLSRMINRLINNFNEINLNPLGACAIGGTSFPINRERTTELLGFEGEIINSLDSISSRDHLIQTIMNITLIADLYSRISEDFIIWTSKEFNFIEIDDGYASVSSAMPQKKNPDTLELIKGRMGRIYGSINQILFMSKGTPSGYVRDFQESKVPLKISFDTIKSSTIILNGIIDTLILKPKNMKKAAQESLILSLDLSEYLAKNTMLSFREAHSVLGALAKKYKNKEEIFNSNNIEDIIKEILKKEIKINQKEVAELLDLEHALNIRSSLGSPNIKNTLKSIKILKEKLNFHKIINNQNKKKIEISEINLFKKISNISS